MISEDGRCSRSHGVSSALIKLQAEAIGIHLLQRKTSWENYEKEFKRLVNRLKKQDIRMGIFGDIDLQEHREWVERVCRGIDIEPMLPLWKKDREKMLREFIGLGFKAIVVATDRKILGKEWLSRIIDEEFIEELKAKGNIDLCGERGEYHTFVYDGPIFRRPVRFITGRKIFGDRNWFLELVAK
jgi:uncharacterized protein (TIGR00290 family)